MFIGGAAILWAFIATVFDFQPTWYGMVGHFGWVPVLSTPFTVIAVVTGTVVSLLLFPLIRTWTPAGAALTAGIAASLVASGMGLWIVGDRWLTPAHQVFSIATLAGVTLAWSVRSRKVSAGERALTCERELRGAVILALKVTATLSVPAVVLGAIVGPSLEMSRLLGAGQVVKSGGVVYEA